MEYFGRKISDIEQYQKNREGAVKYKDCALILQFAELDRMLNISKFSKRFLRKTQAWFSQRLNKCVVNGEKIAFKEQDYVRIAAGFRELAKQLDQYADELDKAEMV